MRGTSKDRYILNREFRLAQDRLSRRGSECIVEAEIEVG